MVSPKHVVVLTGAGISQESGIRTFRDAGGLWEGHRIEEVASPEGFARNPRAVLEFYNLRRRQLRSPEVAPNAAHLALADFEKRFAGSFLLVTQNVDNLHERAGSKNLLHMHGSLIEARCSRTGNIYPWEEDLFLDSPHPEISSQKGGLRPNIVWFGEMPMYMEAIEAALSRCDLFVSIGTSGQVYPAAAFVHWTPAHCRKVEINYEVTEVAPHFDECFRGKASERVPEFFSAI